MPANSSSPSSDQSFPIHFLKQMVSGGGAGAVSRTLMAPLERTKVLLQVQDVARTPAHLRYKGIVDCLVRIPREQGILAYWRGNGVNVARMIPNSAIKFSTYDTFKGFAFPNGESEFAERPSELFLRKMACGGISGVATIIPVYPMDLARTRLTADVGTPRQYTGLVDCVTKTARAEGPIGLYKGLGISLCGIIPYLAISLSMYDSLKLYTQDGHPFWQSPLGKMCLGSVSALVSQSIAYPVDTVRRHLQVSGGLGQQNLYSGTFDCISKIYNSRGIAGFYRGLLANAVRAAPQAGIEFAVYDMIAGFMSTVDLNKAWKRPSQPHDFVSERLSRRLSSDITDEGLAHIEKVFRSLDKNAQGVIETEDFVAALVDLGYDNYEVNRVLANTQHTQLDKLDFFEFRRLCNDEQVSRMLEELGRE